MRHLRIQSLWVQEVRSSGRLAYRKVLGTLNPSDVLTKHVPGDLLDSHLTTLGVELRGGRAESAPTLNSLEVERREYFETIEEEGLKCLSVSNPGGVDTKKEEKAANSGGVQLCKNVKTRWADIEEDESDIGLQSFEECDLDCDNDYIFIGDLFIDVNGEVGIQSIPISEGPSNEYDIGVLELLSPEVGIGSRHYNVAARARKMLRNQLGDSFRNAQRESLGNCIRAYASSDIRSGRQQTGARSRPR